MSNLTLAIEMAKKSSMDVKHGAVIFTGSINTGKVFSTGYNRNITSKIKYCSLNHLNGIHAEMDCLLSCRNIFSIRKTPKETRRKFNMIVVRCKDTGLAESAPCILCQSLLRKFRIKKVYYSSEEGDIKVMKMNLPISKVYITKGLHNKMKNSKEFMNIIMGVMGSIFREKKIRI